MVRRCWIKAHAAWRRCCVATAFLLLFFAGGFLGPGIALASTSVSGRISTNTTWTLAGSPYIVTASVSVYGTTTTPITLTLEAGVIVKFQPGTLLTLGLGSSPGILNAVGTDTLPIIFTSIKDDTAGGDTNGDGSATSPAPGNWGYIYLSPGSNASLLDHVQIRYGGSGPGSLYIYDASPTIQNSTITQSSSTGLFIVTQNTMSAPTILDNQITQNATDGIYTQATFSLTPVGGLIQGNAILGSGQYGLYLEGAVSAAIRDNQIEKSLYFTSRNGSPVLTGNQIMDIGSVTTQVPADVLGMFQAQNTLSGITPTTSLYVISDTMAGTTTLTTQWYRYIVTSGLIEVRGTATVPSTLVVQAGVHVLFDPNSGIRVGATTTTLGALQVLGTTASPVLFTRLTAQNWAGIILGSGTVGAQTTLQNVEIDYGNSSTDPNSASLSISSTSPTLTNVTVRLGNPSGISLFNASPVMTGVTVDQVGQDGITISSGSSGISSPVITQALITNTGRYGIYMSEPSGLGITTPNIEDSVIQAPASYGLYIDRAVPTILNNTIAGSLFLTNAVGSPVFTGNTISNFNTKTARVPIDILQHFDTQNTLLDIDAATVLELLGDVLATNTTLGTPWKIFRLVGGVITISGTPVPTLTILPGVTMRFGAGLYISVGGANPGILVAHGTAASPILFSTLAAAPNNWRGLYFSNTAVPGASSLDYVTVDQAGSVDAAIRAVASSVTLSHCSIQQSSKHGIELYASNLTMQYCKVILNAMDGLLVDNAAASYVSIANSDLYGNSQGGIVNNLPSTPVDARNSWWGDASGPGGSGPGSGNSVGAQVLYDPWLGTSYTTPFAITNAAPSSAAFTPSGGQTTLAGTLTLSGSWTVQITDATSTVLKSATGSGPVISVPWDGTDGSGTVQPNGTYNYRIDATGAAAAAPVIGRLQLNSGLPVAVISQPTANQLILTPSVAIVGSANGAGFSSYSIDIGLGASPLQFLEVITGATAPVTSGMLATWTPQADIPTNVYQIRLRVTGTGGTAEATQLVNIDHTPPLPPLLTLPVSPSTTQPVVVTGTTEGNAGVDLYDNGILAGHTTAAEDGTFTFPTVTLTLGNNILKAQATDEADNVGVFSADQSVVYLPPGQPIIEILSPADGSTAYK
jgi:Right handed beta helix region